MTRDRQLRGPPGGRLTTVSCRYLLVTHAPRSIEYHVLIRPLPAKGSDTVRQSAQDVPAEPWRSAFGTASRSWSGAHPRHRDGTDDWMTLRGARDAAFNVVVSHSGSPTSLAECLEPVRDLGVPTTIKLCGTSLGNARQLADAGWICIGALPLTAAQLEHRSAEVPSSPTRAKRSARLSLHPSSGLPNRP